MAGYDLSPAEERALHAAEAAAEGARGATSPNPPVGAAILDADGRLAGVGATHPPGGPHAEVAALSEAGDRARGGTAVVTLEPCNHTGRTGPCAEALLEAGIARVLFAQPEPTGLAGGGADFLRSRGIEAACLHRDVPALRPWLVSARLCRPHVTAKWAQSLDGFARDHAGKSQWITGERAREFVHEDREKRDAIVVGTGTALADDPSLTARRPDGSLRSRQPRRVVVGRRGLDGVAGNLHRLGFEQHATIDEALSSLWESGARDVLVEGGPTLIGGFLSRGLVDAVQAYIAPALLIDGLGAVAGLSAPDLGEETRLRLHSATPLGDDLLVEYRAER